MIKLACIKSLSSSKLSDGTSTDRISIAEGLVGRRMPLRRECTSPHVAITRSPWLSQCASLAGKYDVVDA